MNSIMDPEICCLCVHVRTATIFFGSLMIITNSVSLLAFISVNGYSEIDASLQTQASNASSSPLLAKTTTATTSHEISEYFENFARIFLLLPQKSEHEAKTSSDIAESLLIPISNVGIAVMLVYGAKTFVAMCLVPYMCMRLFKITQTVLDISYMVTSAVRIHERRLQDSNTETTTGDLNFSLYHVAKPFCSFFSKLQLSFF